MPVGHRTHFLHTLRSSHRQRHTRRAATPKVFKRFVRSAGKQNKVDTNQNIETMEHGAVVKCLLRLGRIAVALAKAGDVAEAGGWLARRKSARAGLDGPGARLEGRRADPVSSETDDG